MGNLEHIHYADALWESALRHRHNPLVAQRLAQLEATIKMVEEEPLESIAHRKQEAADTSAWWAPAGGFQRGVLNTVAASTGTGKSMWGSKYLEDFYKECQKPPKHKTRSANGK